jgi:hypothetical protein
MTLATITPFIPYVDPTSGDPVDDGYLYFGTANLNPETSPITVYWDVAGLIPAAQPIRTIAGLPANNGRPSHVYSNTDYAVTVKDKYGRTLYYSPTSTEYSNDFSLATSVTALAASLASNASGSVGAGQVGFAPKLNYVAQTIGRSLADREWNPRDYPWLAKFDGATDDTAAIQACWQALYDAGGGTMVMPRGTARATSIVMNYAAGVTVNVRGQGQNATYITKIGTSTDPVLDIKSNTGVLDVYSNFSDFHVTGISTCTAIKLTTIASLIFRQVTVQSSDIGFDLAGALVLTLDRCSILANAVGFRTRKSSSIYCNSVRLVDCDIRANTSHGINLGDASDFLVEGGHIEANGTAADLTTGAVRTLLTCDDETGTSSIVFRAVHFESNLGKNFVVDDTGGLLLTLDAVDLIGSEGGRAMNVGAILNLTLKNVIAASPGDVVTIGAGGTSTIVGGDIATITDSSTSQIRINTTTSGGVTAFSTPSATVGTGGITIDQSAKIKSSGSFTQGNPLATFQDGAAAGDLVQMFQTNGGGGNAAACTVRLGKNSVTSRSINAGGTVNASGADYAEYETKRDDCGVFAKGDIVGFDADGLLTDKWSLAVTFGIKSTSPCLVGGDEWGAELEGHDFEAARARVDRIAYAGKVPVNMAGASPGDWIGAAEGRADSIVGAVGALPSLGRVRRVLPDGRPLVVVGSA